MCADNNNSNSRKYGLGIVAGAAAAIGVAAYTYWKNSQQEEPQRVPPHCTPNVHQGVTCSYFKKLDECVAALQNLKNDLLTFPVLGMDCQWTRNPDGRRNPIALLQLATHKGKPLLIAMNGTIPKELKEIMGDANIIKVGMEVIKDAQYLKDDYGLEVKSTFDLRFLAEATGHTPDGLDKLAKVALNRDLDRGWELATSDWQKIPLDDRQIGYAKESVQAAIDVFKQLIVETGYSSLGISLYCEPNLDCAYVYDARKWQNA